MDPGSRPLRGLDRDDKLWDFPAPRCGRAGRGRMRSRCAGDEPGSCSRPGGFSSGGPQAMRRERSEGHTVAHHTWSHPLLSRIGASAAEAEIDRGIAAVDGVLYGKRESQPVAPFFRFPGFASSPALLDYLARRRIVVFGADLWASDWNPMSPDAELRLVLRRLEQARGGIVLFHDTKRQTAAMLPALLRALKARGL